MREFSDMKIEPIEAVIHRRMPHGVVATSLGRELFVHFHQFSWFSPFNFHLLFHIGDPILLVPFAMDPRLASLREVFYQERPSSLEVGCRVTAICTAVLEKHVVFRVGDSTRQVSWVSFRNLKDISGRLPAVGENVILEVESGFEETHSVGLRWIELPPV
jgi:hypothetical protein